MSTVCQPTKKTWEVSLLTERFWYATSCCAGQFKGLLGCLLFMGQEDWLIVIFKYQLQMWVSSRFGLSQILTSAVVRWVNYSARPLAIVLLSVSPKSTTSQIQTSQPDGIHHDHHWCLSRVPRRCTFRPGNASDRDKKVTLLTEPANAHTCPYFIPLNNLNCQWKFYKYACTCA